MCDPGVAYDIVSTLVSMRRDLLETLIAKFGPACSSLIISITEEGEQFSREQSKRACGRFVGFLSPAVGTAAS